MIGYSENKGGVESYITNLNSHIDHEKYEIIYSEPTMMIDGKEWIRPKNRHNYIRYWLFWKIFYKENKFDVVYLNTCDVVSIDDLIFAKKAGIPVRIIHSHSSGVQQELNGKMSLFHKLSEKKSRRILSEYATNMFACSNKAGKWMFDTNEFAIIKNGIELNEYEYNQAKKKLLREKHNLNDNVVVGCIGRISPVKNIQFAIDIMDYVLKQRKDISLVIIGEGEDKVKIKKLISCKNLSNKIHMIGAVDNVNEWMSAIDCLLMPSLFEGLPFVLVEAQAAGLPCVVSSNVSEEANITGLVHYLSLDDDVKVWADKIMQVCGQRQDVSEKLVEAGYSIEETARKVSSIIDETLKSRLKSEKNSKKN